MRRSLIYIHLAMLGGVLVLLLGRDGSSAPLIDRKPLVQGTITKIIVWKAKRRLEMYAGKKVVRSYRIALGSKPVGDKVKKGDRRTPEGKFHVRVRNARSSYYLSLGIDYPAVEDARRGLRDGLIDRAQHDLIIDAHTRGAMPPQNTRLGGDIYIHGNGSRRDWTWGCVALDDPDMKEVFDAVAPGTEVLIRR